MQVQALNQLKAALNQLMPFATYQCHSKSLAYQDLCMQDHGKKQMNWLPKKIQCTRSLGHKTTKRFLWEVQGEDKRLLRGTMDIQVQ